MFHVLRPDASSTARPERSPYTGGIPASVVGRGAGRLLRPRSLPPVRVIGHTGAPCRSRPARRHARDTWVTCDAAVSRSPAPRPGRPPQKEAVTEWWRCLKVAIFGDLCFFFALLIHGKSAVFGHATVRKELGQNALIFVVCVQNSVRTHQIIDKTSAECVATQGKRINWCKIVLEEQKTERAFMIGTKWYI